MPQRSHLGDSQPMESLGTSGCMRFDVQLTSVGNLIIQSHTRLCATVIVLVNFLMTYYAIDYKLYKTYPDVANVVSDSVTLVSARDLSSALV